MSNTDDNLTVIRRRTLLAGVGGMTLIAGLNAVELRDDAFPSIARGDPGSDATVEPTDTSARYTFTNIDRTPSDLSATIQNRGSQPGTQAVTVLVNETPAAERTVALAPMEEVSLSYVPQTRDANDINAVEFRTEDDSIRSTVSSLQLHEDPTVNDKILAVLDVDDWSDDAISVLTTAVQAYEPIEPTADHQNTIDSILYDFTPLSNTEFEHEGEVLSGEDLEEVEEEFAQVVDDLDPFLQREELQTLDFEDVSSSTERQIKMVAHAVWCDENGAAPWSLENIDESGLTHLFQGHWYRPSDEHYRQPGSWIAGYHFAAELLDDVTEREEAFLTIAEWAQSVMRHVTGGRGFDEVYGNLSETSGEPAFGHILIKKIGGCHASSPLIVGLLRALNVPASTRVIPEYWDDDTVSEYGAHACCFTPEDQYLHGDHPFSSVRRLQPIQDIVAPEDEFLGWINGLVTARGYIDEHYGLDIDAYSANSSIYFEETQQHVFVDSSRENTDRVKIVQTDEHGDFQFEFELLANSPTSLPAYTEIAQVRSQTEFLQAVAKAQEDARDHPVFAAYDWRNDLDRNELFQSAESDDHATTVVFFGQRIQDAIEGLLLTVSPDQTVERVQKFGFDEDLYYMPRDFWDRSETPDPESLFDEVDGMVEDIISQEVVVAKNRWGLVRGVATRSQQESEEFFALLTGDASAGDNGDWSLLDIDWVGPVEHPVVCEYTGPEGGVETPQLLEAISDWRANVIGTDTLLDVIDAWRTDGSLAAC